MIPLTVVELQTFIRGLIGRQEGYMKCAVASVEFGPDGGGVILTSWDGIERIDLVYEFENPTELALMVRTGWLPQAVAV